MRRPLGNMRAPAGEVRRRILRIRVARRAAGRARATATAARPSPRRCGHGGAGPPEELRAATAACARKLPRLARAVAATSKRAHDSLQIVPEHGQARARVELAAHVSGEFARERRPVARGRLVHEQRHARGVLGRAQEHRDRRRELVGALGCAASTRVSSARVSRKRTPAGRAAALQRATPQRSARSALRAASS